MPIGAGTGTGLSLRTLGTKNGAETKTIASGNLPPHTHTITHGHANTFSISVATNTYSTGYMSADHYHGNGGSTNGHGHAYLGGSLAASGTTRSVLSSAGSTIYSSTDYFGVATGTSSSNHNHDASHNHSGSISGSVTDNTTSSSGDGGFSNTALDVMNPWLAVNFIIKT